MRRASISIKLLTIYLVIAIPLVATIALSYYDRFQSRTEIVLRERTEIALLAANSFTLLIKDIGRTMEGYGRAIIENRYPPDRAASTLERLIDVYPISNVILTDATGKVVASTDANLLGQDFSDHEAIRAVMAGNKQLSIEPLERDQEPVGFHVAFALRGNNGNLQGVIASYVDIAKLDQELPVEISGGGVNIIDSNGYLVFQGQYPGLTSTHPFWGRYGFVKTALAGMRATGTFTFPATGRPHIVAEVPIREFGWAAGSSVDREQVFATIRQSLIYSALLAIAILLVAFAVSILIARRITRSLSALASAAHSIGEGDFSQPVSIRTGDEVEDVANTLDAARIDLRQAQDKLRETARLSNALNDISAAITSTLDFDQIMHKVVIEAAKAVGCEAALVNMREDDYWMVKYGFGFPQELIGVKLSQEQARLSTLTARTKETIVIDDAYGDERLNRETVERFGIRSVASIPLITKGDTLGVMFLAYRSAPIPFTDIQIDFAGKLAILLSLSLENVRLYEVQRNIAETLQTSLLAVPEQIEGIEFGHLYRSATEAAQVGGDFYDIFEIEHGKVGIIIGDVSGKGIEAASLTTVVKNTIKAHAYEKGTPSTIMAKANELARRVVPAGNFITVFFGVLDVETGRLSYCSAGHPPAIIKREEGGIDLLDKHSPFIGAFPGFHYITGEQGLEKGDILITYTDGIIEARCDGGFYGHERLVEFIKNLEDVPVKEIPEAILNDVTRCLDGRLSDDVAILAVSLEK